MSYVRNRCLVDCTTSIRWCLLLRELPRRSRKLRDVDFCGAQVIPQALLDHVMANYKKPADLIGENGMLKQLTKTVIEAALKAEMNQHLGLARFRAYADDRIITQSEGSRGAHCVQKKSRGAQSDGQARRHRECGTVSRLRRSELHHGADTVRGRWPRRSHVNY